MTDLENALPMLEKNIKANEKQWKSLGGVAKAQALEWGKEVKLNFIPDIILLTDCVYYEEVYYRFLLKNFKRCSQI